MEPARPDPNTFRRSLLRFYDRRQRDLPWRRDRDPWRVLVSEIMLQQTTVAAVVPYYERFLGAWPTAADLAACDDDALNAAWAGLGYYRRARLLKAAARAVAEHGMPDDRDGLLALPGVGDYTAAAVASIALQQPVAAVDGNVERVVSRLYALDGDPRKAAGRRRIRELAQGLLAPRRPGDFNQAMMELGATVCRPKAPRCGECPVAAHCAGRASGDPTRFPPPPRPRDWLAVTRVVAVAERDGRVLLVRRDHAPNEGFLELPGPTLDADRLAGDHEPKDAAADLRAHLRERHGLTVSVGAALPPHKHVITRHRIVVLPHRVRVEGGRVRGASWVAPRAGAAPLTTAARRVLAQALPDLPTEPHEP